MLCIIFALRWTRPFLKAQVELSYVPLVVSFPAVSQTGSHEEAEGQVRGPGMVRFHLMGLDGVGFGCLKGDIDRAPFKEDIDTNMWRWM